MFSFRYAPVPVVLVGMALLGCTAESPLRNDLAADGLLAGTPSQPDPNQPAFDDSSGLSDATFDTALALGLSDEEVAYLSLLFSRAGLDFDLTRIPADTDGDAIPNVVDEDIDGDCILNSDDRDVDGDGELNVEDDDIDGDGVDNDDDDDIDSDGLANDDDPDADSDGLSDRWDLDDDSDGISDDEDEDDMDDEPRSRLEDLVDAVANRGWLNDFEQQQIAIELARRFDNLDDADEFAAILRRAEFLNGLGGRPEPLDDMPRDFNAVDEIYKQLAGAIDEAKRGQFNPDGPIANSMRLQRALADFKVRANAVVASGELFGGVRLGEIGDGIVELGAGLGRDRLDEFINQMRDTVPTDSLGDSESEGREFGLLVKGGSRIGDAFDDENADTILGGISRLRTLALGGPDGDPDEEEFDRLLTRLSDIKSDASGINLDDAIDQIVEEESGDEDNGNDNSDDDD